ncbi:hypothetical protein A5764_04630 [Mycobacterium sp. 852002-51057_SCH5723018]|nr:hypothetical protein A5764_04630 [Mycobacterium sp. 852002-51057_SCH5723018]
MIATLVGAAIGLGSSVLGAAPANAAPHPDGSGPNPFGTLSCGCPDAAPGGGQADRQAITRGIREGLSGSAPALPAAAAASKLLP